MSSFSNLIEDAKSYLSVNRSVCGILGQFTCSQLLEIVRDSVENEPSFVKSLVGQAYSHPNGFDKIVLFSDVDLTLRLHVWWPDSAEVPKEHIHSHRWDMMTHMLVGEYDYENFEESNDGEEYFEHHDSPAEGSGVYTHTFVGKAKLRMVTAGTLSRNSTFYQRQGVPHRVLYKRPKPTATLMVHGSFRSLHSRVFTKNPLGEVNEVKVSNQNSLLSEDLLIERINRVLRS